MWIHYERLHNHNKAKHNKTVCIFLGIYCKIIRTNRLLWILLSGTSPFSDYCFRSYDIHLWRHLIIYLNVIALQQMVVKRTSLYPRSQQHVRNTISKGDISINVNERYFKDNFNTYTSLVFACYTFMVPFPILFLMSYYFNSSNHLTSSKHSRNYISRVSREICLFRIRNRFLISGVSCGAFLEAKSERCHSVFYQHQSDLSKRQPFWNNKGCLL